MSRQQCPVRHPDSFYIDGAWVAPASSDVIDVVTPSTEELYVRVAAAQEEDICKAVAAARKAFDAGPWPRLSHAERAAYMLRMAEELEKRAGDIGDIWSNEMGIVRSMAGQYSEAVGWPYRTYAGMAATFPFEEPHQPTSGAAYGLLRHEPVGVVGAIIPWNGPILLIGWKVAPALLAGCTLVIKASPEAPGHALVTAEAAEAAGMPPGVINVVTADRGPSEALVRNPDVDKISFTGSTAAGKTIASIMGGRIGRYTMELGGKSAALILDDYDIGQAAAALTENACGMTGQVCAALTRVIVPRRRHDEMVDALAERFNNVSIGDPFEDGVQMGPLATGRQRERVESYIEAGKREGARIAAGGNRPRNLNRGFYIEPTLFADVENNAMIAREEIFGPILSVIPVDDEAQAVATANASVYGLNNAVFTNDTNRALDIARQLRPGTVGHNGLLVDFGISFGGYKQSGVGREGGIEGLRPYLESKTILLVGAPSAP